ncbi:MAG TPA: FlgD immunoglobulin-like domain containing protein [Candidatus Cloacimonadota bacterium]|nr:FlgD immunoglobulin-like domain containing protein [Candidatus Cloacimonadota bacterium]HQL14522.1 FlgD immunoglobulin-like domain containing protein [Candidatus Cloacimonadota bacterium]
MKKTILFIIALTTLYHLFSINVGGHLTQNTTWSPNNNPYVVTSFLYVDSGVTLTILPGVQVEIVATNMNNYFAFWWNGNTQPQAKGIVVNGRIIANGTSANPITFDKHGTADSLKWASLQINAQAQRCSFEHCTFSNSLGCKQSSGDWSFGPIYFLNGGINVKHCNFYNNFAAIEGFNLNEELVIYDCRFIVDDEDYPPPLTDCTYIVLRGVTNPVPEECYNITIANCYFSGFADLFSIYGYTKLVFLNNNFENFRDANSNNIRPTTTGYISFYGNRIRGQSDIELICAAVNDTAYCRRNDLDTSVYSSGLGSEGTLSTLGTPVYYLSDNRLGEHRIIRLSRVSTAINFCYNNKLYSGYNLRNDYPDFGGEVHLFNNVFVKASTSPSCMMNLWEVYPSVYNNVGVGFNGIHSGFYTGIWANNIATGLTLNPNYGVDSLHYAYYQSNCFNLPLLDLPYIIDLGGNIVADPVFADTLNSDYHLAAGSPCIDTGAPFPDSLGVAGLPPFDADYHVRTVGAAADMGAYEYGSVYIGGIRAYVYDSATNLPIDCAKLEISGKLPEFSDSLGYQSYPTGAGTFTLKVTRWDYQDLIIPNIQISTGEELQLQIPLVPSTVGNEDDTQTPLINTINLSNYPNPFSTSTKLSFILPESGKTNLIIYNAKGQKVRTLLSSLLKKGYNAADWDGRDDNGRMVGSGLYFSKVTYNGSCSAHKLLLLK